MKAKPKGWREESTRHRDAYYKGKQYKALSKYADKNFKGANVSITTPWKTQKCDICHKPAKVLGVWHYMGKDKRKGCDHIGVHKRCESKVPKGYHYCGCGG